MTKKRIPSLILIFVCAVVFAVSAIQLGTYFYANHKAESEYDDLRTTALVEEVATPDGGVEYVPTAYENLRPMYENLYEANGDFVGWLMMPGTNIDYPVMQTKKSPEYYIDKNFQKKYSAAGSLFCSEISDVERPTDAVIIYGHHMKTGAMFGRMEDLVKPDNFDKSRTVVFDTLKERNEYTVYGLFRTQVYTDDPNEFAYYSASDFASMGDFDKFMGTLKQKLVVYDKEAEPKFGDKIIMLSTCEYSRENGRLVLVAVRNPA